MNIKELKDVINHMRPTYHYSESSSVKFALLDELVKKLEVAIDALEFYAGKDYIDFEDDSTVEIYSPNSSGKVGDWDYLGAKARQALKKSGVI